MNSISSSPISNDEIAGLITETGHHHHQAYIDSDGVDPDWALWYAPYIQTHLWDRLGRVLTRSEIVYALIATDIEVKASATDLDWSAMAAIQLRTLTS
jgi:hypothetical protein